MWILVRCARHPLWSAFCGNLQRASTIAFLMHLNRRATAKRRRAQGGKQLPMPAVATPDRLWSDWTLPSAALSSWKGPAAKKYVGGAIAHSGIPSHQTCPRGI